MGRAEPTVYLQRDPFILFYPRLAVALQESMGDERRTGGVEQALIIAHLQFRLVGGLHTREIDGRVWYAATWKRWEHEFPFWSNSKIRRMVRDLKEKNLVLIEERPQTNWYSLDYDALLDIGVAVGGQDEHDRLSMMNTPSIEEEANDRSRTPIGPQPGQDDAEGQQDGAGGQQLALDGNQDGESGGEGSDSSSTQPSRRNLTREVWDHYVQAMKPRRKEPDEEALRIINGALKVATVDECKRAIDGCLASDWHMGRHSETKGKKYNKLSQILKGKRGGKTTREMIDQFLEYAEKAERQSGVPSADSARIDRRKQEVRDMHAMAGDPTVVERGQKAEEWLRQLGITATVEWEEKGGISRPIVRFHQD